MDHSHLATLGLLELRQQRNYSTVTHILDEEGWKERSVRRGETDADVSQWFEERVKNARALLCKLMRSTGIFIGLKICTLITVWVHRAQQGCFSEIGSSFTFPSLP